MTEYYH